MSSSVDRIREVTAEDMALVISRDAAKPDKMKGRSRNKRCPCGSGRKFKHCCVW